MRYETKEDDLEIIELNGVYQDSPYELKSQI